MFWEHVLVNFLWVRILECTTFLLYSLLLYPPFLFHMLTTLTIGTDIHQRLYTLKNNYFLFISHDFTWKNIHLSLISIISIVMNNFDGSQLNLFCYPLLYCMFGLWLSFSGLVYELLDPLFNPNQEK